METPKISQSSIFIIIIIVILIIAAILYFTVFKKMMPPKGEKDIDQITGKPITWTVDEFPLKKGSSGIRVKQLQAGLNIMKNNNLAIDGKFGDKTLAALQEGYNVTSLSEANYNTYIVPNMSKINDEINKVHPANKPPTGGGSGGGSGVGAVINATVNYIGKSISAAKATTGYAALADSDLEYVINENSPIKYTAGQYIGVVEKEVNGWFRCVRSNGTRVFVIKLFVKL